MKFVPWLSLLPCSVLSASTSKFAFGMSLCSKEDYVNYISTSSGKRARLQEDDSDQSHIHSNTVTFSQTMDVDAGSSVKAKDKGKATKRARN